MFLSIQICRHLLKNFLILFVTVLRHYTPLSVIKIVLCIIVIIDSSVSKTAVTLFTFENE